METLKVEVWRGTEDGKYQAFEVPRRASQTVLDVVTHIQRFMDPTLAYRFAGSPSGDIDRRALRFYDRFVFPVSRWSDRVLKRVIGKNVLVVAERRA